MAKKKSTTKKKTTTKKRSSTKKKSSKRSSSKTDATGKHLVIVESPSKARNINQYLGTDYVVKASVGHVRDLPSKAPKGSKQPVPGVDLENDFAPTYEILPGKKTTITELKRLAKKASSVWFATDLDREGEAIAWHLAQELGIPAKEAKRVVFNAVTRAEILRAFDDPHVINEDLVNAQQARRILDRIVGYQVSPLLWKKVARGLSAGRVQSVAVRVVVEREREIKAFIPDEFWAITARLTTNPDQAPALADAWDEFILSLDDKGNTPTVKKQNQWISEHDSLKAELFEVDGKKPTIDGVKSATDIATRAGFEVVERIETEDEKGKGPAKNRVVLKGRCVNKPYRVKKIEAKKTTSRPSAPFITSTMQQAASSRLGFGAQRTMRTAQQLYEGIQLTGRGIVGLITYMRTDSVHLSKEAIDMVRGYIGSEFGDKYLPDKPNKYSSSNKKAQEAHEAIRPTDVTIHPNEVSAYLKPEQAKLYRLIWNRFVSCQMTPAKWDSTTILMSPRDDADLVFKATGRRLAFDGFYRVAGVPTASDEQVLPALEEGQDLATFNLTPVQKFTSPPPRYTEASLVKTLEEQGIGRPSTYAEIIQKIQDRKYVEQRERRFYATDLGEVVTDKLIEAFPKILNVDFTRVMETELDQVEAGEMAWTAVLDEFYGPFRVRLEEALETLQHAKAETQPAPDEYRCEKCNATTVYRFGRNGRFLSCSRYPDCDFASPIDSEGKPRPVEVVNVGCPQCGSSMTKRSGRFGPFLGCSAYPECDGILKLDKRERPLAPQPPPYLTDLPCPKCESPLYLRNGKRGPWLSCSKFPKCRGRGAWAKLEDDTKKTLEDALAKHEKEHPIPIIKDLDGNALTDERGQPLETGDDSDVASNDAA